MKYMGPLLRILLLQLLFGIQLHAQPSGQSSIAVERPWARATPAGAKTGAVYMTIINNGATPDRLLGATTPVADKVQIHKVTDENGVSSMRELSALDVPPGSRATFRPGDIHAMLVGLKQPLKEGQTISLTLEFEKAGKIDVAAAVAKVGAMQGGDIGTMDHGHDGHMQK